MPAPPVQYVKTSDGYDIACFVAGAGNTIIRAPNIWNHVGSQWSSEIHGAVFDRIVERFRLVLYDSRGQGLSTRNLPATVTLDDYVTDLETVIERFAPERFVLDGWSFMSVVALQYAIRHPERVEAVILHNYIDMHVRPSSPLMINLAASDWPYYVETTARTGWPTFNPKVVTRMLFDAMSQADHILQSRAVRAVSGESLLSQIQAPILFLTVRTGSQPLSAEESTKRWAATLPNARLVLFDDPGGALSLEAIDTIERFLAGLDVAVAPDGAATAPGRPAGPVRLSPRETEVLRLIAAGKSNQQIADELVLSPRTVERHISNLYAKIGAHRKTEAAAYAFRHGLD
jgi:DNA-binding CsgD family transcriptional regulator/pimeloyl-ACP methyl ester carboxylesterase